MIPDKQPRPQSWKAVLAAACKNPQRLAADLNLSPQLRQAALPGHRQFSVLAPKAWLSLIERGNPRDPLLLQILPGAKESAATPGFATDPVGDRDSMRVPGLLHKYRGRVLLIVTGGCAINCRYCFRRHFPYHEAQIRKNLEPAIRYIASHQEVTEVILSGGDPLLAPTAQLHSITAALARIGHIKRLRLHTRIPLVLPERVDGDLLTWLECLELQKVVVIHCNHPRELDPRAREAIHKLRRAGCTLLNQSVLLRGINDDIETLTELSERLFASKVIPYYLHQMDHVAGAAHFAVADQRAAQLLDALRCRLPGYLVPKLVREIAGTAYKQDAVPATGV